VAIWAIVPVKPFHKAKSRLSKVLTGKEQVSLRRRMLTHTLETLAKIPAVERTLVLSRDSEVLALARDYDARTVSERGNPHLNRALVRASLVAQGYGVSAVLVLPADLPLVTKDDIEKLIASSGNPPEVILAPDRKGEGTNAILSSPPGLIEYDFGAKSLSTHRKRAREAGARVVVCELPSLSLDLDAPDDLEIFRQQREMPTQEKE
jgi:2-phospho-L-lactate guanylyltransferase